MKINKEALKYYLELEEVKKYDDVQEYIDDRNKERERDWTDIYPNEFKTEEEADELSSFFKFTYYGKIYFIYTYEAYENIMIKKSK